MPIESIGVIAGIITAFATFAVALAYGESQTRHLNRLDDTGNSSAEALRIREQEWLKAA